MGVRLCRKAKIRRVKKRRAELKSRHIEAAVLMARNAGGVHAGQSKGERLDEMAPEIDEWDGLDDEDYNY